MNLSLFGCFAPTQTQVMYAFHEKKIIYIQNCVKISKGFAPQRFSNAKQYLQYTEIHTFKMITAGIHSSFIRTCDLCVLVSITNIIIFCLFLFV